MKIEPFMLHKSTLPHLKATVKRLLQDPRATWEVSIKKWSKKRSLSQNKLSHVWYADISKELVRRGRDECTPPFVKDLMKNSILGTYEREVPDAYGGQPSIVKELVHTSTLPEGEMHFYLCRVQAWALDYLGLLLSADSESEFMNIKKEQER